MINYPMMAQPQTFRQADVPSASDTTLHTVIDNSSAMLEMIKVCNKTAGAVTFDAWYDDGVIIDYLFKGKSVPANETFIVNDLSMRFEPGAALKVKGGAAASLDVTATMIVGHRNTSR